MRSRESDHPYVHSPQPDRPFSVLRQIAFASAARPGLKPADTSAIIAASRTNNARKGITGVLVYSGESFLVLVEGPDDALAVLWRRLILDCFESDVYAEGARAFMELRTRVFWGK